MNKQDIPSMNYLEFLNKANNKQIEQVKINLDKDVFKTKDTNGNEYLVNNPKYDDFKKDLLSMNINVKEIKGFDKDTFIDISIIALLLIVISSSGAFKQIKSIDRDITNNKVPKDISFKNVAGLTAIKKDMDTIVDFMKNPQRYVEKGAEMPRGAILYGEPGTGKTLLAKAIAGEAEVPFLSVSGSEFVELFVGQGAKRVRKLFHDAKVKAPCIIFIDEIDAIGKTRGKGGTAGNNELEQTLNQLLIEIDGFNSSSGIFVIGATNRLDTLDSALLRQGRFDKHICVPLPSTPEERLEIIKMYSNNKLFAENVDFNSMAKQTIGFSPADIKSLLNEATLISVQLNKQLVDRECIDKAIFKKALKGHEGEINNRGKDELKLIAYHEAGHAITARILGMDVPKVTIIPSTSGAGGVTFITPNKINLLSKEEIENNIMVKYGGRNAERILLNNDNKVTTGAEADIESSTKLIMSMITQYAMISDFGMLNMSVIKCDNDMIINKAIEISNELNKKSYQILINNIDKLEQVANALIEKETISGEELDRIIKI